MYLFEISHSAASVSIDPRFREYGGLWGRQPHKKKRIQPLTVIPENQRAGTRTIYPGSIAKPSHGSRISALLPKQSLGAASFRDDDIYIRCAIYVVHKKPFPIIQRS